MTDAGPLLVPSPDPAGTRPAGYVGMWPPVCAGTETTAGCGHRHVPGGSCADHVWRDDCPYTAGPDCPALVEVTATDGTRPLSSPGVVYVAVCAACVGTTALRPQVFGAQDTRDEWAMRHADEYGHSVALAVQTDQTGTVITGHASPDPDPAPDESDAQPAPAPTPAATPTAPLVAFVVPQGGPPDLMCRIPNRAGAAWLAYAAHACLLGRQGSAGIPEPHRAMFIGKVTPPIGAGTEWRVRVDGVIGAHRHDLGQAIGFVITVPASATLPIVEDLAEHGIAEQYGIPPHEFSVLLVTDAGYGDPPDPEAAAMLRAAQQAREFGYVAHAVEVPAGLVEQVDAAAILRAARADPLGAPAGAAARAHELAEQLPTVGQWPGCPVEGHTGCTPHECRPAVPDGPG